MYSIILANGKEISFDRSDAMYAWAVKNKPGWFEKQWVKEDNASKRQKKRRGFMKSRQKADDS